MDVTKPAPIKEFPLKPITARKIIVDLAENHTGRVKFGKHIRERMRERGVSNRQVLEVLRSSRSYFTEDPHPTPKGSWKFNLRGFSAGTEIEVVVDLRRHDEDPTAYLITVIV